MHVDPIEGIWLGLNILTAVIVTLALRRQLGRLAIAKAFNGEGHARAIVAGASVRHQVDRLAVAIAFIVVVMPGLFVDRPVPLSPLVVVLLAVPAINLLDCLGDWRDWRRLDALP